MSANWVKELASATGAPFTGNITLGGAETGFISFFTSFGLNRYFHYTIVDGSDKEVGIGHLSSAVTLVRDQVLETLVSGTLDRTSPTAISVAASSTVMVAQTAQTSLGAMRPYASYGDTFSGLSSLGQVDQGAANYTFTASYLHAIPFWWGASQMVQTVAVSCTTSVTNGEVEIGLYEIGDDGQPGMQIVDFTETTTLDCSTTGLKSQAADAAHYVASGFYFLLVTANSSTIALTGPLYSPSGLFLGMDTTTGAIADTMFRTFSWAALPADESAQSYTTESSGRSLTAWLS